MYMSPADCRPRETKRRVRDKEWLVSEPFLRQYVATGQPHERLMAKPLDSLYAMDLVAFGEDVDMLTVPMTSVDVGSTSDWMLCRVPLASPQIHVRARVSSMIARHTDD